MSNTRSKKKQGFVLVYTVLILGVMILTAGIFADTIMKEVGIARDEGESLKAFYAADAGIECVRYLQNEEQAFDPTRPRRNYNCGVGNDFYGGFLVPVPQCVAHTYSFTVDGFSNGACTEITVQITPRTINVNGLPIVVCDAEVISEGRNRCSGSGKVVERTRWETL